MIAPVTRRLAGLPTRYGTFEVFVYDTPERKEHVALALGAIDDGEPVLVAHPDGIEAVVDVLSDREALGRIAGLIKKGGRVASSVYAADAESLARHGIKATNVGMKPDAWRLAELARLADAGEISVGLESTFPLQRAHEALEEIRKGHVRGKIVLLVD